MEPVVIVGWDLPIIHAMGMEETQAAFLSSVLFARWCSEFVLVVVLNEAKGGGPPQGMLLLWNEQCSSWLLWRFWYMVRCHPGAAAPHKRRAHTSRCLQCHTCIYTQSIFVCAFISCMCLFCQPIVENVLSLPRLVLKEIWLKWMSLVLIGCSQLHSSHTQHLPTR